VSLAPEVQAQILRALALKAPRAGTSKCAGCGQTKWELLDGFVIDEVVDDPKTPVLYSIKRFAPASRRLISVGIVCQVCGNTLLFNVLKLGLEDLVGAQGSSPQAPSLGTTGYSGLPQPRLRK
jgi:hypothetical protein